MRRPPLHLSIRTRLMAVFILVIVLPASLTALAGMRVYLNRVEMERQRLSAETLQQARMLLTQTSKEAEVVAQYLATLTHMTDLDRTAIRQVLENAREVWPLASIEVFDEQGRLLAQPPLDNRSDMDFSTKEHSSLIRQALQLEVVTDFFSLAHGLAIKSAVPVVELATLRPVAAIIVTYPLNEAFLQEIRAATKSHICILRHGGELSASTFLDSEGQPLRQLWDGAPQVVDNPAQDLQKQATILGSTYATAYSPLRDLDGGLLGFLGTAVELSALETSKADGLRILGQASLLALIVAIVVSLITSLVITRPVYQLVSAMERLSLGDFQTRTNLRRRDEFGYLGDAFNFMARNLSDQQRAILGYSEKLQNSNAELERFNQELESMVLQRTRELARTNEDLRAEIHKHQRTEIMLEEARQGAESANKAKSEFLATMSHEIRTPLNVITGMTDYTLGTKLTTRQRECLETIQQSSGHLLQLINDLLDFSKIEVGKLELEPRPFLLRSMLQSISRLMEPQALDKGLFFHLDIDPNLPEAIVADDSRLRQILLNFLSNAVKFTASGSVSLRAQLLPEPPPQLARQVQSGKACLRLSVCDTGIGISENSLKRIFESFTQGDISTTRRFGGVGLGLAIAKRISEHMRGIIEVESKIDAGSCFCFCACFPLASARDVVDQTSAPPLSGDNEGPLKILLVEDNPLNVRTANLLLSRLGHMVDVANNGREAVVRLTHERYDLVLMDLEMPEMDGLEATRVIRNGGRWDLGTVLYSQTPIVAMTAHALVEVRERCLAAGMTSYLPKPVSLESLQQVLASIQRSQLIAMDVLPAQEDEADSGEEELEAPLDREAALDYLEDPLILEELLEVFGRGLPATMNELETCIEAGELEAMRLIAHRLKSDAPTIGANVAGRLARETDRLVKDKRAAEALASGRKLLAELRRLRKVLEEEHVS